MTTEESKVSALSALETSSATGGGPKSSMPVAEWVTALNTEGLIMIPTFHGIKGDNAGYRSGEIHGQLRQSITRYFYTYRVIVDSEQPHLFVSLKRKVLADAGIPKGSINEYKEVE